MKLSGLMTSNSFTFKSFCHKLYCGGNCPNFPVQAIWKSKAPTKVCFFAEGATQSKIPTEDMLNRRNFNRPSRYFMFAGEKRWWTTSLFIVVEFHHFGTCLYP